MDADDVVKLAEMANPGKLVVTHLPIYGDRENLLSYIKAHWKGDVVLASHFLKIEV